MDLGMVKQINSKYHLNEIHDFMWICYINKRRSSATWAFCLVFSFYFTWFVCKTLIAMFFLHARVLQIFSTGSRHCCSLCSLDSLVRGTSFILSLLVRGTSFILSCEACFAVFRSSSLHSGMYNFLPEESSKAGYSFLEGFCGLLTVLKLEGFFLWREEHKVGSTVPSDCSSTRFTMTSFSLVSSILAFFLFFSQLFRIFKSSFFLLWISDSLLVFDPEPPLQGKAAIVFLLLLPSPSTLALFLNCKVIFSRFSVGKKTELLLLVSSEVCFSKSLRSSFLFVFAHPAPSWDLKTHYGEKLLQRNLWQLRF